MARPGWTLSLPIVAVTLALAPWRRLAADTDAHPWCGGVVCLVALWHLQPSAEAMLTGVVLTLFFVSGRGIARDT